MSTTTARILDLARVPRRRVALSVVLGALTVICGAGLMATAGYLIVRAAERPAILSLGTAIVAVRFFGLARPLSRYAERLASHDVALRALAHARVAVYRRLEPLAPAQLRGYRDGDLLARVVADVDRLQDLHLRGVGPPLVALLAGAACVGAAAVVLPAAALILAAGLLLAGVAVPLLAGALGRRAQARQVAARGALSAELLDTLVAAPELVVYGAGDAALERAAAADRELARLARRDALVGGLGDGLGVAIGGVTVVATLLVAAGAVADGRLDRVLVALLALLALAAFEAVTPLTATARELPGALAAGRRLLELADIEPKIADPPSPAPAPPRDAVLALEGVRARYGFGERAALEDVTLHLRPGRRVALVGPSGAGKTTVVNLLLRFLDPEAGRVTLAGRDLRDYRQEDVRRAIAVAGQDAHLFSTSIRENVRLARPECSDAELTAALDQARIGNWVRSLPQGWDTAVGERGRALSGGQRQRIVLARALLSRAPVLVLDEPTAHLDEATATLLMRDVFAAAGDRAVLLITHRPEGLDAVDQVVTLDAGRVVASSPPAAA
ncbi:putative ABC transporter ATP-binding/permease protein [Baekduia alba]|uniref:thiol reductant ABC exporter subunit CydC n=1 Tax=Baekduia alba TaxID=2997333 RepID=UPI002341AB79|nr:thiol reductant ABC exporter subunit CydC [Baekduia alba]WCB95182.1 putative ABC transporter ATP-binding/permease protein [Baekduia alba]